MFCPSGTQWMKVSEQTPHLNTALASPVYINKATLHYTTEKTATDRWVAWEVLAIHMKGKTDRCVLPRPVGPIGPTARNLVTRGWPTMPPLLHRFHSGITQAALGFRVYFLREGASQRCLYIIFKMFGVHCADYIGVHVRVRQGVAQYE